MASTEKETTALELAGGGSLGTIQVASNMVSTDHSELRGRKIR